MTANSISGCAFPLLRQVPAVLRARGFRLYTQGSRRLVDLWLNGGAAVLGHTPPNILRELKNTASRGLYAPFPHFTESRFLKALLKLFPGYFFRLYAAPPQELISLFACGDTVIWRPFVNPSEPYAIYSVGGTQTTPEKKGACHLLVLPGIQTWRGELPLGLCVAAAKSEEQLAKLPPGDILPPVLLAVAARGVYDILAMPQRAKPVLPRTFKAMKENPLWQRQGIYLCRKKEPSPEEWAELFRQFLDAGFLLPPIPQHPVILPGELSAGEDVKLAKIIAGTECQ